MPENNNSPDVEALLEDYFARDDHLPDAAVESAVSLYDLRRLDEQLIALVDAELVSRGGDEAELRFVLDDIRMIVARRPEGIDVVVMPRPDELYVESAERRSSIVLDQAGGGSAPVQGVVRLRAVFADREAVSDPFSVP